MKRLSVGVDSTLGNYRKLCVNVFGEESPQTAFIDQKIADSPANGEDEEVVADESQMLMLLASL